MIWPDYAYVPGRTPRHSEDAFDHIRQTAERGMSVDQLAECDAFCMGLRYLDAGFYWEAHELLEPVWMVLPDPSRERQFVQGLIQIANGYLKMEMERPKAAARLVVIAQGLISDDGAGIIMGVDLDKVRHSIASLSESAKCAL